MEAVEEQDIEGKSEEKKDESDQVKQDGDSQPEDSKPQETKTSDLNDETADSELTTEPSTIAARPQLSEEERSKFDLLDKLFSFLDTEEELNPVLSGYFAKLVNVFLNRKAKDIYRYVYTHEDGKILSKLAYHIYSKSLTEILIKFLDV